MSWGPLFSIWIGLSSDLLKITRKTDSLLDLVGNCGGFLEALKIIGSILVFSYNSYALRSTLALNLVRFVPS